MIKVGIGRAAPVPGDVGFHALLLHLRPDTLVTVEAEGAADGTAEGVDGYRCKLHAGCNTGGLGRFIGVDDGVGETTGAGDERYAAVAKSVELGQAARFEARGHEDDVGARLHDMG